MKRMEETVEFGVLCSMFEAIVRCKKGALKRKHVRTFLEHVYNGQEHFSAMRLILPDLDKERANYGLREAVLAKFLADALGLSKESEDAKKLINWRKGGQRAGSNAGNFSMVASEVVSFFLLCLLTTEYSWAPLLNPISQSPIRLIERWRLGQQWHSWPLNLI